LPDLSLLLPLLEEVIAILKRSTGSSGRHATIRVGGGWHMTVLEVVMGSMVPFTGGGGWDRHKKDYEERERERERERRLPSGGGSRLPFVSGGRSRPQIWWWRHSPMNLPTVSMMS
jgi:hypothetical protein